MQFKIIKFFNFHDVYEYDVKFREIINELILYFDNFIIFENYLIFKYFNDLKNNIYIFINR